MENEGTAVDAAKRIIELEAQLEQSEEEYVKLQAKEEMTNTECNKLKEKLDSEGREWRAEWWKAEVERRKLEVDLKKAAKRTEDAGDEVALQLKAAEADRLKVLELVGKIAVLEKEKGEWDAEMHKLKTRLRADYEAKRAREAENLKAEEKISDLIRKIDVLEKEKAEREAGVCQAKERSEEIKRILKEMKTSQEINQKRILELISSEEERMKMDTKGCAVVESEGNVELVSPQRVHPVSDVGPTTRMQGSPSVNASANKPKENSNNGLQSRRHDGRRVLRSDVRRRKVEAVGCSLQKEAGTKRCKSDGLEEGELVWSRPEKLLDAFTASDELCMRAICALYRKQNSLGRWQYCLLLCIINKGFMQDFEKRGMALGELLTRGDPQGRLKRSLAELEQADVEECRFIAKHHYMDLFQIYKDNLDSFFESSDEMN